MAHLNVRERRVEAKVAYVGPELSGKGTNLEQLGRQSGKNVLDHSDDLLSIDYLARSSELFRDCDVQVKVVARRGPLSSDVASEVLADVDGVVLVVDALPTSRDKNRAAARVVQDVIAARRVPVVVQVNKMDAPQAVAAADIVADLGESWPYVSASAERGEGVVETIERTLDDVLDVLRRASSDEANGANETAETEASMADGGEPSHETADEWDAPTPAAAPALRGEGHPLLDALRQVLRDTVAEHVVALEARLASSLEERLAVLERDRVVTTSPTPPPAPVRDERALEAAVTEALAPLTATLETLQTRLADVHRKLQTMPTREDVAKAVEAAMEARAAGWNESVARATAPIVKAVEAVQLQAKEQNPRTKLAELASTNIQMNAHVSELTKAMRNAPTTATIAEMVRAELGGPLVDRLNVLTADLRRLDEQTSAADTRAAEADLALERQVTELLEDWRKKKKSWFT